MRFFASLADWLVQRVFWLSVVAMASTAQADVILWQQAPGGGLNQLAQISPGEMRSQSIDLSQAARVERITLDLRGGRLHHRSRWHCGLVRLQAAGANWSTPADCRRTGQGWRLCSRKAARG